MGWRFRKSIGTKFLRLNISKTGFSLTGGIPGAHVNTDLSNRRKGMFRGTFSLPGSGLSYVTKDYGRVKQDGGGDVAGFLWVAGILTLAMLLVLGAM